MEYLQLFDENGHALNKKISRANKSLIEPGDYYMIMLLFIENSNDELLIQLTSKEKGSVYALTGGHVVFGDDGIKTAIKETREELGIDLNTHEIESIGLTKVNSALVDVYYIKKDLDLNKLVLQESEVESVSWMSVNEINDLINDGNFRKTNIEAFKLFMSVKKKIKKI